MKQLRIWDEEYLNSLGNSTNNINHFKEDYAKRPKQELWELSEENVAYKSIKDLEKIKNLESLILSIGLSDNQVKALSKISQRRSLINETIKTLELFSESYKKVMSQHKQMLENPFFFYQKNKKLRKTENDLLTYGSLSLSYSFCSPYRLISSILKDAESVKMAIDLNDEIYGNDEKDIDFDFWVGEPIKLREQDMKYKSFLQDLRGNKVPEDLLSGLLDKIKFEKRERSCDWGFNKVTKTSIIDSFYIFFGSKRGSDFVEEWKNEVNREKLKEEFEYLIYNNPYVNPALVDYSLEEFLSKKHIESAEYFLKENKNIDLRYEDGNEFSSWSRLKE
jgi:hypothetical protein